jgi:hypothetical protein
MGGKFLLRRLEDAQPHALRVALPFQDSLFRCFRQFARLVTVQGLDVARGSRFEN